MKLRQKTSLTIGLALAILTVLSSIIVANISLRSFAKLETQSMHRDIERAKNGLATVLAALKAQSVDYGLWDDTYAFVAGEDPGFVASNLDEYIHEAFDLDLVLFTDTEGNPVYAKGYDFEAGEETEFPEETLKFLQAGKFLFGPEEVEASYSGIVKLPTGPALYAATPIITSQGEGPVRGTLIMARYFTDDRLTEISETTQLSLQNYALDDKGLPKDVNAAYLKLKEDPKMGWVNTLNDTVVVGYTFLPDIFGNFIQILRVDSPRDIYQQGISNVRYLTISLVVISVIIILLALFFLERLVLSRLGKLGRRVRRITQTGDTSKRIILAGQDELNVLAQDINSMLAGLEQKTIELTCSNAELEQFAYTASHDLQEPLRKIQAFGDRLVKKKGPALGEDGQLYLERMKDAANRMQTLIQDLLSYSRIGTKTKPFVNVDLDKIAKEVISDLEIRIEQSGAKVELELEALPKIEADALHMRQLLQNLIGNALKFNRDEIPLVVNVSGQLIGQNKCKLIIKDNGIGFDDQHAGRIFGVFQRLHGRSKFEGSGIGLSIVRKIIDKHKGSIKATGVLNQGATFTIILPIRHGEIEKTFGDVPEVNSEKKVTIQTEAGYAL